jgi:Xaa-Pro aminopeptidase
MVVMLSQEFTYQLGVIAMVGIAVRIEDDILITANGPVNLSAETRNQMQFTKC